MKKTLFFFIALALCINIQGQTNSKKNKKIPDCYFRGNSYGFEDNYYTDKEMVDMLNSYNIEKYNSLKGRGFRSGDSIIDEINKNQIIIMDYQSKIKNQTELTKEEKNKVCEIQNSIKNLEKKYANEIQIKRNKFYENERISSENQRAKRQKAIDDNQIAEQEKRKEIERKNFENEKELKEFKEWQKTAKFKIPYEYKETLQTKECKFCFKECQKMVEEITKEPDFSKFKDKDNLLRLWIQEKLEYSIFKHYIQADCDENSQGCRESKSGYHAYKIIKTSSKQIIGSFENN